MVNALHTNEQAAIIARSEIAKLKSEYSDKLRIFIENKDDLSSPALRRAFLDCQKAGSDYFNFVETFVGDSDLLGAHDNSKWVTGFAEDCYVILKSMINHYNFLRSYAADFGLTHENVTPSEMAFANMQRMVIQLMERERGEELKKLFLINNLPIRGFDMAETNPRQALPTWQVMGVPALGLALLLGMIGIAIEISNPTEWQKFIFRGSFSMALAAISSVVPGFLYIRSHIQRQRSYFALSAGGAIAVFVLVWKVNPGGF